MKKRGHYCKVCGEYKANEKFSGKGHAAHICKNLRRSPARTAGRRNDTYPACQPSLAIIQRTAFVAEKTDERQAGCRADLGNGTV